MQVEKRYIPFAELRVMEDASRPTTIVGKAIVYNSRSEDLGGFREFILPGAFSRSLETADVRALIDHNPSLLLGRSKSGTLRLVDGPEALTAEIDLPDTSYARDLMVSLQRGDVSGMSFCMNGVEDEWSEVKGQTVRSIRSASIHDVSIVTYPAYPETSVALRSLKVWQSEHDARREIDLYRLKLAEISFK